MFEFLCVIKHRKKYVIKSYTKMWPTKETRIEASNQSHLYWKKHFHKNSLCFGIIAHSEADNEIDNSSIGNKTANFFKQNPVNIYICIKKILFIDCKN